VQTSIGDRWTRLAAAVVLAPAVAAGAAGCLGLDVAGTFRWPGSKSEQLAPARMAVTWKNDIQKKSGKNMLRGFEGKVQFFAVDPPKLADKDKGKKDQDGPKKPDVAVKGIPADGTLTVYAFEETADGKEGAGPSKKYVFPPKELRKVHREGPQGHEYNVWLAWDKAGGMETHIRLLARFDPTGGGQVVMSDNSREVLPGLTIQYASGVSPDMRKTPHDSTGHPVTHADFETDADTNRGFKSSSNSPNTAIRLDENR
jgi:hypothetical protein